MSQPQDDGPRCSRCRAPVSRSGGRCPFCGAPVEGSDGAKPFEPAVVGMTDQHVARDAARKAGAPVEDRGSAVSRTALIACGLAAVVVLGVAIFAVSRRSGQPAAPPPEPVSAAPAPSPAPLNVNGIVIASPGTVDPTDLLPAVKRRLAEPDRKLALLGIEVVGAARGHVDLDSVGAAITYRFLLSAQNPRTAPEPPAPEFVELSVAAEPRSIARAPAPVRDATTVSEPTCVWSAAWRAAVASGLSPEEPFDAKYGAGSPNTDGSWVFRSRSRPELSLELDGQTCAIKTR